MGLDGGRVAGVDIQGLRGECNRHCTEQGIPGVEVLTGQLPCSYRTQLIRPAAYFVGLRSIGLSPNLSLFRSPPDVRRLLIW